MKESVCLQTPIFGKPEGKYTIELTDPRTRKIKEKIRGKNAVFPQSIFSTIYASGKWIDSISATDFLTVLSNDNTAVDLDVPYIFDPIIGYGKPTTAGSGVYKGSYVSANQILAQLSMTSVYWKWQYEFTPTQANGIIKSIGLTNQYYAAPPRNPYPGFKHTNGAVLDSSAKTTDGRYSYSCSNAGIVTIIDMYLNISTTVDISATVGDVADSKHVGYAPTTGKFYIYVYSSTPANRKIYVFSDNTFATNETTYTVTNILSTVLRAPFFVYGTKIFSPSMSSNKIYVCDFNTNEILSDILVTPSVITTDLGGPATVRGGGCSTPIKDGIVLFGASNASTNYQGCIFDIVNEVPLTCVFGEPSSLGAMLYPFPQGSKKLPCYLKSSGEPRILTAYTKSVLETPVEKTSSYSMTVTYELEIPWVAA